MAIGLRLLVNVPCPEKQPSVAIRCKWGDEIIDVGDNWERFARENDAPDACFAPHLIKPVLWDHISDRETHHLYRVLVTKVRETQIPITLPLRCDAPEMIRHIELTLIPKSEGVVAFESRIKKLNHVQPYLCWM